MLKVVEAFSGIGSQAKALKNIKKEYEILATIDWDIHAIIGYDLIHNGEINLELAEEYSDEEIRTKLEKYSLSMSGKVKINKKQLKLLPKELLRKLYCSIKRTNNLISIVDVKGTDLPNEIDMLTYSFPCQDLSLARAWHGETGGISKQANTRSGMLWQVERILEERIAAKKKLPKFLLMENVTNILSDKHKEDFDSWKKSLGEKGYYNYVYKLNSEEFGIPQRRWRAYMLSVQVTNESEKKKVEEYFKKHDLNNNDYIKSLNREKHDLVDLLKIDYNNKIYKEEADDNNPVDSMSRDKIYLENTLLYDGEKILNNSVNTITTKQDRNPNAGIVEYPLHKEDKARYRNLTPRECFLLMGFSEEDFQVLIDNNIKLKKGTNVFRKATLHHMAGNSIVVNVLEEIFKQVIEMKEELLEEHDGINEYKIIEEKYEQVGFTI